MNETIIQTIPTGYVPSYFLYIVASIAILCFFALTYAYKTKKTNWGNFWQVIIFSALILGIIIGFLVTKPDIFVELLIKLKDFFN